MDIMDTSRKLAYAIGAATGPLCVLAVATADACASGVPAGLTLFVDDDAPAGGDGASWETAFRFLQDALHAAPPDTVIRVAQGSYEPDRADATPEGTGDRLATFRVGSDLRVCGGYAGLLSADPNERDFDLFPSVLSGDLGRDDQPDFAQREDNSVHVLIIQNVDDSTWLEGFTIRGGAATGPSDGELLDRAGALLLMNASPFIWDCTFTDNQASVAGGAVEVRDGSPLFDSCSFIANAAGAFGGAVNDISGDFVSFYTCEFRQNGAVRGGAVATSVASFTDCSFEDNAASNGGGIHFTGNGYVKRCVFRRNHGLAGGAISADYGPAGIKDSDFFDNTATWAGGAIVITFGQQLITRCRFVGNSASSSGAVSASLGSSVFGDCTFKENEGGAIGSSGSIELSRCSFEENHATYGGAVVVSELHEVFPATALIDTCDFLANEATVSGGAISVQSGADVTLIVSTLTENTALFAGGAVHVDRSSATIDGCVFTANTVHELAGNGGAVANEDGSNLAMSNCTFDDNRAGGGGAIASFMESRPRVTNCSFNRNAALFGGAIHSLIGADIEMFDCTFEENHSEEDGGAFWSRQSAPRFEDCVFRANTSGRSGAGAYIWQGDATFGGTTFVENESSLWGGGICVRESSTTALFCTFESNNARAQSGDAVSSREDSALVLSDCTVSGHEPRNSIVEIGGGRDSLIERTTFEGNQLEGDFADIVSFGNGALQIRECVFAPQAGIALSGGPGRLTVSGTSFGGWLELDSEDSSFDECTFVDVRVTIERGTSAMGDCAFNGGLLIIDRDANVRLRDSMLQGARLNNRGTVSVSGCVFDGAETAFSSGTPSGSAAVANSLFLNNGTAMLFGYGRHRVANCTLVDNGVGFEIFGTDAPNLTFTNTIVWASSSPDDHDGVALYFCDIENGWSGEGRGNFSQDPLFFGAGDYRIRPESPCLDAGWNNGVALDATDRDDDGDVREFDGRDLAGESRFVDDGNRPNGSCGLVDIGAFELQDGVTQVAIRGDVDGNGSVGAGDLLAVLARWGDAESCGADLDADGVVGYTDVLLVLLRWS